MIPHTGGKDEPNSDFSALDTRMLTISSPMRL